MSFKKIIKDWMLPIAMMTGASVYLIYRFTPSLHFAGPFLGGLAGTMQPLLIFSMLFLTFCRIEPKDLKPHRWHWWLLLIQGGLFTVLGLAACWIVRTFPENSQVWMLMLESAMLCFICPTATAAAVVTRKLGGDVPGIITYTVLINLVTAALVPLIVPVMRPVEGMDFWVAFSMIMAKIFPLLIMPCLAAWMVRYMVPRLYRCLVKYPDIPFYLWSVGLALAVAVTTRTIANSDMEVELMLMMAVVSLFCCIFQFVLGRYVGSLYRPRLRASGRVRSADNPAESYGQQQDSAYRTVEEKGKELRKITAGQSLGQKNTIFAIWMAYTFMTPETSIVGGLYSIWHNIFNSWQLYKAGKS